MTRRIIIKRSRTKVRIQYRQ